MATGDTGEPLAPAPGAVRVGLGFDVHPLVPGRPLRLGGVEIPFPLGLAGHSDGDALLHAVIDGLLGAANAGDIGSLFPDTDMSIAGIDSREMLREAGRLVAERGWTVSFVDAVVVAAQPRLAPYREAMAAAIRESLGMPHLEVSVKGKSGQGLEPLEGGKVIACLATVTLVRHRPS